MRKTYRELVEEMMNLSERVTSYQVKGIDQNYSMVKPGSVFVSKHSPEDPSKTEWGAKNQDQQVKTGFKDKKEAQRWAKESRAKDPEWMNKRVMAPKKEKGAVWETPTGKFAAKNRDRDVRYFKTEAEAREYSRT